MDEVEWIASSSVTTSLAVEAEHKMYKFESSVMNNNDNNWN
jgi:hypothetical protein